MAKTLKLWNGRWYPFRGQTVYVAAYSRADAVRLLNTVPDGRGITDFEIKTYWSGGSENCCWGTAMEGIQPERGAWLVQQRGEAPKRLV